jgi:hypothetical protein
MAILGSRLHDLIERLGELARRMDGVSDRLAGFDHAIASRLDDQIGRLVRAVTVRMGDVPAVENVLPWRGGERRGRRDQRLAGKNVHLFIAHHMTLAGEFLRWLYAAQAAQLVLRLERRGHSLTVA